MSAEPTGGERLAGAVIVPEETPEQTVRATLTSLAGAKVAPTVLLPVGRAAPRPELRKAAP